MSISATVDTFGNMIENLLTDRIDKNLRRSIIQNPSKSEIIEILLLNILF